MALSSSEAERLYKVVHSLHLFAGQVSGLWPATATTRDLRQADRHDIFKARDVAFKQPEVLESFLRSNPAGLTPEEMDRARQWRHLVVGDFYIERLLKKGAVFIEQAKAGRVFLVSPITDPWDELVDPYALPQAVSTVLLPFDGRIVTDGLMLIHRFHFGGGIARELREIYLAAKQNDRIITSLPPAEAAVVAPADRVAPWAADIDAIVAALAKWKGGSAPVQAPALRTLQAAARLASQAAHQSDDVNGLWDAANDVYRGYSQVCTVLKRSRS